MLSLDRVTRCVRRSMILILSRGRRPWPDADRLRDGTCRGRCRPGEAYTETLAYDCRLMNVAAARNQAVTLRDWLTESDEWLSPQAAILSPRATCRIGEAIVRAPDTYLRTVAAGKEAVAILREGAASGKLQLAPKE